MWLDHEPAWAVSADIEYSPTFYSKWVAQKLHNHVATRPTQPMWLHFPVQNVHAPYVLPPEAVRRDFPTQQWNDHQELRSIYMNLLALLDDMVGNITASLRKEEMRVDLTAVRATVVVTVATEMNTQQPTIGQEQCS